MTTIKQVIRNLHIVLNELIDTALDSVIAINLTIGPLLACECNKPMR